MKKIIFTKFEDKVSDKYFPKSAHQMLPDWYKKTNTYISGKKDIDYNLGINSTIKKCIPVFDALTSGYIIETYCDLWVKKSEDDNIMYITSSDIDIEFHPVIQAPYHPKMNQTPYPKWINPWGINTPKGYSCLFMPPVHGGNKYFTIIEGVVDTDKFSSPVNFPFVLNDPNFEGLIPAGTPMVQIIPIKREKWTKEIGKEKDKGFILENRNKLVSKFYDRYKTLFWEKKHYK